MSHTEGSEDNDTDISHDEKDKSQTARSESIASDKNMSNISLPKPRQHVRCTSEDVELIVELYRY